MEKEFKILFLSGRDCATGLMAERLFSSIDRENVAALSAGLAGKRIAPQALKAMSVAGIGITRKRCRTVDELGDKTFDLIITLDNEAKEYCHVNNCADPGTATERRPLCIGMPIHLHWSIDVPGDKIDYKMVLKKLRQHVNTLLSDGYLTALAVQRKNNMRLIDSLGDGIIVHDNQRHIYVFNREAERITGYKREDVLGRDCHTVFGSDGICGGQCAFRDGPPTVPAEREYQVKFTSSGGESKLLRMTVNTIEAGDHGPCGVIASIRDITEVSELRWQLREKHSFQGMIGVSSAMREVFETIRQVVASDYPVLISGESGTGKELAANAIHNEGRRRGGPFVPINCGALPENILESELFGHVRGAFTGAIRDKKGRFELADGGTLFLDEVSELTPAFQVKLLRVLQEKRFERVGGEESISVDVRIISATNRSLREAVKEGKFREDLFYRLCVVPITLPSLRERREDIPPLIEHILLDIRKEIKKKTLTVSDNVIDKLLRYDWPGNVRELINTLRFSTVRCAGDRILLRHLPPEVREARGTITLPPSTPTIPRKRGKLDAASVRQALAEAGGNKIRAARILRVGRATLYRFLSDHPEMV